MSALQSSPYSLSWKTACEPFNRTHFWCYFFFISTCNLMMESLQIQKRLRLYLRFGGPGVDSFYFKEITSGKLRYWRKPPISRFLLFPALKVDTLEVWNPQQSSWNRKIKCEKVFPSQWHLFKNGRFPKCKCYIPTNRSLRYATVIEARERTWQGV